MATNSTEIATDKHKNPIYAVAFTQTTQSFEIVADTELEVPVPAGVSTVNFSFDKADNVYVSTTAGIVIPTNATIGTHAQEKNPSQRVLITENGETAITSLFFKSTSSAKINLQYRNR